MPGFDLEPETERDPYDSKDLAKTTKTALNLLGITSKKKTRITR